MALGVLFGFVRNQGDGWTMALNYLLALSRRRAERGRSRRGAARPGPELPDPDHFFLGLARQLGLRTGEMHRALAEFGGDDPAFAPEPITPDDIAAWRRELQEAAEDMLARLAREPRPAAGAGARPRRSGDRRRATRLEAAIRQLAPDEYLRGQDAGITATITSARCSPCRTISTSSISRASRRGRWRSAGARIRRCAMSPG